MTVKNESLFLTLNLKINLNYKMSLILKKKHLEISKQLQN